MSKFSFLVVIVVVIAIGGGIVFVLAADIPAPSSTVEKVIPDARFPR